MQQRRASVDLCAYPDLVVIYLGFHVNSLRGLLGLMRLGRGLTRIARDFPEGLLAHEQIIYGLRHIGMRQYWRDLDSLERFTRSEPHRTWWREFLAKDSGAGFWHETYRRQGGMEAVYVNMPRPIGFGAFADARPPTGPFMSARDRLATG
ncbi:phenylacetaldoxime dehydratase family protein [Nitrospirillum sp. BR 11752]|uniref:phenylacetaldoxime dehydratase family protein n=1 Tax=Nitrospirillum sp. BR 11752 TaxID=3104293 RepID=UPI002EB25338|nr:phenylacetaldoxime dehydratase family protein [Nitrospirillum sp. BR 11752]